METFGGRLKQLRETKNLKQDQLGHYLSIAPSTIGAYERNTRQPNFDILVKTADYFSVSLDYLLCRTNDKRTVEMALKENSRELRDFLTQNAVLFNGNELTNEDKRRVMDILTGLFWSQMSRL